MIWKGRLPSSKEVAVVPSALNSFVAFEKVQRFEATVNAETVRLADKASKIMAFSMVNIGRGRIQDRAYPE